jgi:hypothetical protein
LARDCRPCESVWSREIGKSFERSEVAEAFEAGPIVAGNKAVEEGVAIGLARKGSSCAAALGFPADGLSNAAVEAFDETVGLRPIRSGQAVIDVVVGADEIEWVIAGRPTGRLVLHIDGEAVGELCTVVGQDGMNAMWEVSQESREEAGRSLGVAPSMDFDINVAGGAVDRDEDIAFAPLQGRQMLQIEVNEADSRLLKDTDTGPVRLLALADPMTLEAAVDGAAGQLRVDATSHHLDDIVQRQLQRCSQLADQRLFHGRQARRQPVRPVRAVVNRGSAVPATDRGLADAEFCRQLRYRLLATLDVGSDFGGSCGIGVQVQFHDARRSLRYEMPWSTPIPSTQSPGTKHESRGP